VGFLDVGCVGTGGVVGVGIEQATEPVEGAGDRLWRQPPTGVLEVSSGWTTILRGDDHFFTEVERPQSTLETIA
jgi:hypothetical protein